MGYPQVPAALATSIAALVVYGWNANCAPLPSASVMAVPSGRAKPATVAPAANAVAPLQVGRTSSPLIRQ